MGEELTVDVDPLASMRCWAIEIELGGRTYDIPALPAADWWPVLAAGDPGLVLDMIESSPTDPFNVDDLLLSGEINGEEMATALVDAVEEAAGRTFHAAFVLATVAASQWPSVNGALVRRGFRWEDQPLGAVLDAIYSLIIEHMAKDALPKFLALLDNDAMTTGRKRGRTSGKVVSEFEAMAGPRPTTGAVATGGPSDSARPRTRSQPRPPRQGDPSLAPRRPRVPRAGSGPAASS